jgi:hypothetical protein
MGAKVPPPAMLIDNTLLAPPDGVILPPEDIAGSLRDRLPEPEATDLRRLLEARPRSSDWRSEEATERPTLPIG